MPLKPVFCVSDVRSNTSYSLKGHNLKGKVADGKRQNNVGTLGETSNPTIFLRVFNSYKF